MKEFDFIALQAASRAFATAPLPDTWLMMTEQQQDEWLDEHKWQPFEEDNNEDFFAYVNDHSITIKGAVKESLALLKARLIVAANESVLPDDLEELDLQAMLEEGNIK